MTLVADSVRTFSQPVAAEVKYVDQNYNELAALNFSEHLRPYAEPMSAPSIPSRINGHNGNFCVDWYTNQRDQKVVPPIELDAGSIDLVRLTKFSNWNPLKSKGYIDAWVIDVGRMNHVCGDGLTARSYFPGGYFEHGAEIADLIRKAASPEKLHVRLEVVDQSKVSFATYLSRLNDEIERTGQRPDLVNLSVGFVVPLDQAWRFTPEHIKETAKLDAYKAVDKDLQQLERLARNTNGPVFISAGNSGKDTVSTYRFAQGANIVIVGANDSLGQIADYTSAGSVLQVNGDLTSHPVCDKGRIVGVRTDPGEHFLDFGSKLKSFEYLNGKKLEDVQADDKAIADMQSALRKHYIVGWSVRDKSFDGRVFTGQQVYQLVSNRVVGEASTSAQWQHPETNQVPSTEVQDERLGIIAGFLSANDAVIDARSLFALVERGSGGITEEVLGVYWNLPTGLSLGKACDERQVYFPTGTSFSAPKAGYVFIEEYLAHHG